LRSSNGMPGDPAK